MKITKSILYIELKYSPNYQFTNIIRKFDKSNIMSTAELKEKIIAKIVATDDDELLAHIAGLIEFEHNEIYQMSPGEVDAVNEGLEQFKLGNG